MKQCNKCVHYYQRLPFICPVPMPLEMRKFEIERLREPHRCNREVTKAKQSMMDGCWTYTDDVDCEVERCSGSCGVDGKHFKQKSLIRKIISVF